LLSTEREYRLSSDTLFEVVTITPPCERCAQADEPCLWKARGPGCLRCRQRKVGCSLVGLKQKILEKKEGKRRLLSEGLEEGSVASLEFSDGVMEQVEALAKELRRISGGLLALVEGVGKLTEAVTGLGKKEVRKEDKETETEDVRRMDKQTEMERREEDSEEEKESEQEGKEDSGKEDGDQGMKETEME
jgi:hypothetical protein